MSAPVDWKLKALSDKGPWKDRHEVAYEGRTFVIARHEAETVTPEELVISHHPTWCGWSSDPDLMNIIGCFTGEAVIRFFTDQIDAVLAQGLDFLR